MISDYLQGGVQLIDTFTEPTMTGVNIRCKQSLTVLIRYLNSLTGTAENRGAEMPKLQPLTHILGQPIKFDVSKPVSGKDTQPTDIEKKKFIDEVNDYYANFLSLPDEKLFYKSSLPGGEMIIRAVGKKSGYPEYETAEMDIEYITAVKLHIEQKQAEQDELGKAATKTK